MAVNEFGDTLVEEAQVNEFGDPFIRPSAPPAPTADTWEYILSEGADWRNILPINQNEPYQAVLDSVQPEDRKEIEDTITTSLYMADLAGLQPNLFYDSPEAYANELFGKPLKPSEMLSMFTRNEKSVQILKGLWEAHPKADPAFVKEIEAILAGEPPKEEGEDVRFRIFRGLWEETQEAWEQSADNVGVDFLYHKVAMGQMDLKDAKKAEANYEKRVEENSLEGRKWLKNLWLSTVAVAKPMAGGIKVGAKTGVAAGTAAVIAGQVGPQLLTLEEGFTAPAAFGAGFTIGAVKYWAEQGSGSIYRQSMNEGLSHKTASYAAAVGGPLYAFVEYAQVNRLLALKGMSNSVLKASIKVAANAATEITEEGVQKVITEGSVTAGKLVEDKIQASDIPAQSKRIALEALHEMKAAVGPLTVLGIPSAITTLGGAALTQRQTSQARQAVKSVVYDPTVPSQTKLRMLRMAAARGILTNEMVSDMEAEVKRIAQEQEAAAAEKAAPTAQPATAADKVAAAQERLKKALEPIAAIREGAAQADIESVEAARQQRETEIREAGAELENAREQEAQTAENLFLLAQQEIEASVQNAGDIAEQKAIIAEGQALLTDLKKPIRAFTEGAAQATAESLRAELAEREELIEAIEGRIAEAQTKLDAALARAAETGSPTGAIERAKVTLGDVSDALKRMRALTRGIQPVMPDQEEEKPSPAEEIPLGVARTPVVDTSLRELSAKQLSDALGQAEEEVDRLEEMSMGEDVLTEDMDRMLADPTFRRQLSDAQDKLTSLELEDFYRDATVADIEELASDLQQLDIRLGGQQAMKGVAIASAIRDTNRQAEFDQYVQTLSPDAKGTVQWALDNLKKLAVKAEAKKPAPEGKRLVHPLYRLEGARTSTGELIVNTETRQIFEDGEATPSVMGEDNVPRYRTHEESQQEGWIESKYNRTGKIKAKKPAKPAPAAKKLPKEPTTLGEDVTGILGGVPVQEAAGLTRAEIQHLAPNQQRALRAAQKRGLRVGYKQGVAETITDARRTMAALITKRSINEKNKMDLASIVLTYVPKRDQGRFIRRVLSLKTPKEARKLTALVREAAEGLIERQAVRDAKRSLSEQIARIPRFGRRMKLRGPAVQKIKDALATLPGDAVADLEAAELRKGRRLDPLSLAKLSKKKKAELEAVRDDLKEVGFAIEDKFKVPDPEEMAGIEAVVGERVLAQLRRLQTDSIAKMTSEEINSIADAIRYALDQDSKQTKERLAKQSQERRAERSEAKVEITHTKAAAKIDTAEIPIAISLPKRVYNFFFQDSLHRWALVESATSNTETTTARVLDQDIHAGKVNKLRKEFEALELLWSEMDRVGWSQADTDRVDEVHKVKLGGKMYKLTTPDIMSLGMNVKSDRNAKQIVRAVDLMISGRKVKTPTIGEIVDAMEILTDKEIAVMDFLPTLNEKVLMPAINDVSEDMLGLILAVDPHYWGLKRVLARLVRGRTVAGPAIEDLGVFQPFLGSKITLRIVPFWSQLLTQIQTASSLHGLAQPMEAARSLLNDGTDRPGYTSWQTLMDKLGRRREKENLITIFERTQGVASDRDNVDIVGSTLLGYAGKAILGWRVSTMAIQSASIPMANTIVPKKYNNPLSGLKVQRGAAQSERINEFSPFLRMRHIGGRTSIVTGDAAAARAVDTLIFRTPGDKSLEGMRRVDRFAIEFIDQAVQRWVADTTKLKVGGKEYWQEVARRTDDAVRKTQPMWDVDERSILGSTPDVIKRSFFIFRSAREAVYNQNLMAIDRYMKAHDKSAAKKGLANTLAMTTISTAMVVGIGLALRKTISELFAAITGRKAPDEDKEPKKAVTGFLADVLETTVEYAPLGRLAAGLGNMAIRTGRWSDIDPDAILFGGPVALAKGAGHLTGAYQAYFEDGDDEKLTRELVAAFNDIVDGIARLKGYPAGGILQLTTQPLERALREKKETKPITIEE